jgi:iron complex transport system substrate-binding protein
MRLVAILLGTIALFAACEAGAAPVSAVDATGARITLAGPAIRIVSLAPHTTELLFAAGAGKYVIGALSPVDWPPEARKVPRIGDAAGLDIERIVALKPDLALVWPYLAPAQVERLRRLGVPVFVSDPRTPEAIADDLERMGVLAGTRDIAERAAMDLRARLSALDARESGAKKLSVFYEIWAQPLYTIGGAHLITAALARCGGENIFAGLAAPAPAVGVEAVLAARPEAIIAGTDNAVRPVWLDEWRKWRDIPAVARDNLFVVDANLLHRPGPRFVDGAEQLCAALDLARANLRR